MFCLKLSLGNDLFSKIFRELFKFKRKKLRNCEHFYLSFNLFFGFEPLTLPLPWVLISRDVTEMFGDFDLRSSTLLSFSAINLTGQQCHYLKEQSIAMHTCAQLHRYWRNRIFRSFLCPLSIGSFSKIVHQEKCV